MTKISVIIPAYNSAATVLDTITAIQNQQYLKDSFEIIVVDDGSKDGTANLVKKIPNVKLISQPNSGPAAARNNGAKNASGEILVFTDSDTVPHPNWLYELIKPFDSYQIMATTGTYSQINTQSQLSTFIQREIELKHKSYGDFILFGGTYNLAIRKELFEQIGGFNEEYKKASGEDTEICYKILSEGHKIKYVPTAIVGHYHPENIGKYLKTQFTHGFWRAKLYYGFPKRISGDSYTGYKEIIETLASSLMIICFPIALLMLFCKHKRILTRPTALSATFLALFITELYSMINIYNGNTLQANNLPNPVCLLFILIIRPIVRTAGFFLGLVKFFKEA